jgi:uncharacterized protein YkwD
VILRSILIAAASMLALAADAQPPAEGPGLEEQVLAAINEVRADPSAYAAKLRQYRGYFEENVVLLPGSDVGLRTREGVAAVDEAIAALGRLKPLPPLQAVPQLAESARELAVHQALVGGTGHAAADGSDAKIRIKKHKGSGLMAEALSYGARDAEGVVRQMIVDDGIASRPNRKILLESKYRKAGVACGPHPVNRSVCVIDLATFWNLAPRPQQVRNPPPELDISR